MPSPRPTIIFMLKSPRAGFVKTRLAATTGDAAAVDIYQLLVERQLSVLPPDWSVAVHYAPADALEEMTGWLKPRRPDLRFVAQCPGDLGSKLTAAVATEFSRVIGHVLVIGGDCPGLDGTILLQAQVALEGVDVVIGPTVDGGYYLLGLRSPQPSLFRGIAWSTPAVLGQTRARCEDLGLCRAELPMLEDVDDAAAWERALAGGQISA